MVQRLNYRGIKCLFVIKKYLVSLFALSNNTKYHRTKSICKVILNAILIPVFNQNGAAIASVITEMLVTMLMTLYCSRLTKIMIRAKDVYTVMISDVLMGGSIWGLEQITKFENHLMLLILDMLVGLSVYTVSSVVTKNDLSELILEKIRAKTRK